jgi:hypothetical protein
MQKFLLAMLAGIGYGLAMNLDQVIAALDGIRSTDVARMARAKGHNLSRQNVDYVRNQKAAKPTLPTWMALLDVAQDMKSRAETGGDDVTAPHEQCDLAAGASDKAPAA